jgi:hypothetical protein
MLTWAGSLGSLMNALSRLSMGYFFDKVGFKVVFLILISIQLLNSLSAFDAV